MYWLCCVFNFLSVTLRRGLSEPLQPFSTCRVKRPLTHLGFEGTQHLSPLLLAQIAGCWGGDLARAQGFLPRLGWWVLPQSLQGAAGATGRVLFCAAEVPRISLKGNRLFLTMPPCPQLVFSVALPIVKNNKMSTFPSKPPCKEEPSRDGACAGSQKMAPIIPSQGKPLACLNADPCIQGGQKGKKPCLTCKPPPSLLTRGAEPGSLPLPECLALGWSCWCTSSLER